MEVVNPMLLKMSKGGVHDHLTGAGRGCKRDLSIGKAEKGTWLTECLLDVSCVIGTKTEPDHFPFSLSYVDYKFGPKGTISTYLCLASWTHIESLP